MTIFMLVLTGINVLAASATIYLVLRVHLGEFKRQNDVAECKDQVKSLRGKIVANERWDEARIHTVVESYLEGREIREPDRGEDLGSMMQMMQMMQGMQAMQQQPQPQQPQQPAPSGDGQARRIPGLLGGTNTEADNGD